jgi:hypothetical protein
MKAHRVVRRRGTPQEDSWYSFLLEAESTPGPVRQEGLGQLKKSNDLIRISTRDLPACSIVPQPTMLMCVLTAK